jgi:hypothetical protein
MNSWELLHLTSSGVQFNCFITAIKLLVRRESPEAKRTSLALDCLYLADVLIRS